MWATTRREYKEAMHAVRIPLLKGLLGHRIFIIRDSEQELFDTIENFAQLKKIRLGQGRFWTDTTVLQKAGMEVIAPVKFESLFYMLEGGRFDYLPRALHETLE